MSAKAMIEMRLKGEREGEVEDEFKGEELDEDGDRRSRPRATVSVRMQGEREEQVQRVRANCQRRD